MSIDERIEAIIGRLDEIGGAYDGCETYGLPVHNGGSMEVMRAAVKELLAPLEAEAERLRQLGLALLEEWHRDMVVSAEEHCARGDQWAAHMEEYERRKAEWEKQ